SHSMSSSLLVKKSAIDDIDDKIIFRIEDPAKLEQEGKWSEEKRIEGFPWKLFVMTEEEEDGKTYLQVDLFCLKGNESNVWFCNASYEITLVNQKDDRQSRTIVEEYRFSGPHGDSRSWTLPSMENLLNSERGFIKDNWIVIEARVNVKEEDQSIEFRPRISHYPFHKTEINDTKLVIDDEEFYVSKSFFALQSPYFRNLFYGDSKTRDDTEFMLDGVKSDDFLILYHRLYRTGFYTFESEFENVLRAAKHFEMPRIIDDVEMELIDNNGGSIACKLRIACQFNLHVLKDNCMSDLDSCISIREVMNSEEYALIPNEIKITLFNKYTNLCDCK
ncbi:hypothetical protein PFISCL1PPCAC_20266, partial [Pristionchus fissidentatus]